MRPLYTAQQSRDIDQTLISQLPISGYELMQRAGRACFSRLIQRWPQAREIVVCVGCGNNGGDGYIIADLLQRARRRVTVCQLGRAEQIAGDALSARRAYLANGGRMGSLEEDFAADLLVDAVFGSGLNRDLKDTACHWINLINNCAAEVLAVDIPSGLDADCGCPRPIAVNAAITVSFITRKRGLYTAAARDHCGQIFFEDLQCGGDISPRIKADCWLLNSREALSWLPPRRHDTHKNDFGHVVVIGGNHGMAGAVCLAAQAALYSGAGLLSVFTRAEHTATVTAICPPLMVHDAAHSKTLKKVIDRCDVIAIGPGLGRDAWAADLMSTVLDSNIPLVVDADALHLLAAEPFKTQRWILTPHPGEAAQLLNTSTRAVQNDRFTAARSIQERYGGVCVLKGAGTVVAADERTTVCEGGNPGMASAGMGDVLGGIIASLRGQGLSAEKAALLGTCAHARAGDLAAANRPRGLSADVVINYIRAAVNSDGSDE